MYICIICKQEKDIDSFYTKGYPKGRDSRCKVCRNDHRRKMQQNNPPVRTKEWHRKRNLLHFYNLSVEDFAGMLANQEGVCAICSTDTPGGRGHFHVDHCHTTGKIRGLLCQNCNTGLGQFKDSPDLLEKAKRYLKSMN